VTRLAPLGPEPALAPVVFLFVAGAGVLAWTHRVHGTGATGALWRCAGSLAVFAPSCLVARWDGRFPYELVLGVVVILLAVAALSRLRIYACPSIVLVGDAAERFAPRTTTGWGVLGLGVAFIALALGVAVSLHREKLLALLQPPEP